MPSTEKGPDVINSETTTTAAVSVTADKVETASYCLEVANILMTAPDKDRARSTLAYIGHERIWRVCIEAQSPKMEIGPFIQVKRQLNRRRVSSGHIGRRLLLTQT